MEKLLFYNVSVDYCNYLRKYDSKVPFIEYPHHNKFFIGVVLCINNINYFAPVSSFKKEDKNAFKIMDGKSVISSIRFNYMFPVVENTYKMINIKTDFSNKYQDLVLKEYQYCNNHREEIYFLAQKVYQQRLRANKKITLKNFYDKIICDFTLLEKVSLNYKEN